MHKPLPHIGAEEILAARPAKQPVDSHRPYAYHVERERTAAGHVEEVATLFLTNRECPFRCLMCDLWQHTTDESVPSGAIPEQIDFALDRLPPARHIKLYNSGNFFDRKAIPPEDYPAIARCLDAFQTVIVENHPKLCSEQCVRFSEMLNGQMEVALGLETVHKAVLDRLNKQMTLDDFRRAAAYLREHDVAVRAFILLRPPFMSEEEGIEWALKSIEFAFDAGAACCSVIPTRADNGIMQQLKRSGQFAPPSMTAIETVLEEGIGMNRGRVFMDLWDLERFYGCSRCGPQRRARLHEINLNQEWTAPISCKCTSPE